MVPNDAENRIRLSIRHVSPIQLTEATALKSPAALVQLGTVTILGILVLILGRELLPTVVVKTVTWNQPRAALQ